MPVYALEPEQHCWSEELRGLAAERLAPLTGEAAPGRLNRPLVAELGRLGLLARVVPAPVPEPAPDGKGPDSVSTVDLCILRESLARVTTEAETALALQGLGAGPLVEAGTTPQRARWLPPLASGAAVAAFALSEPQAGSDAAALTLTAEPDGAGRHRLDGTKTWISNAPEADVYTVFARTGEAPGAHGITAYLVPADRPGLRGEPLDMLSPHPLGTVEFEGVPVTEDDRIGPAGGGFRLAMRTLNRFRPSVGAFAVGMAGAALDASLHHADERRAFGGPLRRQQSVAHTLAEMATRTEAARTLVYAAAAACDRGDPDTARRSAMAKLFATETAQYVVDSAVQLHGASALRRGHLLEHLYREVRAPRIYEGATEVQRTLIAKELYR
ncbi:acyl-CoA dehydrogenase family protein [Streptomyces xiaopingdaonensis]|uniref:acyl-CoA dehydrogenase family protein n=1 Tax=Streptomyces xiaopingdaonensis TaxID=1565415 RepID=UPI00031F0B26|nr:acyl-CoA dehydrogenase family protein [Streptomyces xiaopingdaonensis]